MGLSIKAKIKSSRVFCREAVNLGPTIPSISDMYCHAGEKSNMKTSAIVKRVSSRMARSGLLAILGLIILPTHVNSALADASVSYPANFDETTSQYDFNPCYGTQDSLGAAEGACDAAENAWVTTSGSITDQHRVVPPWTSGGGDPPTNSNPPQWTEASQYSSTNWETYGTGDYLTIVERCDNGGSLAANLDDDFGNGYPDWCLVQFVGQTLPSIPPPTPPAEPNGGPNDGPNDNVGDPINPGSGNVYVTRQDYKGSGPFPLVLARAYNSLIAGEGTSPDGLDQTLGFGWTNGFAAHLFADMTSEQYSVCTDNDTLTHSGSSNPDYGIQYVCPSFVGPNTPTAAIIWRGDGSRQVFNGQYAYGSPSSGLVPQPGTTGQLTYSGEIYTYLRNDGYSETYNSLGQLTAVKDPHGLQQTYAYNSNGQLTSITDPTSRQMVFAYYTSGRIQTVTAPSSTAATGTATITYGYDASGNLQTVTYTDSNNASYSSVITYEYNDSALPHAMTGVRDEDGNEYLAWSYNDTTGQATCSELAPSANAPSTATTCTADANGIGKVTIGYNSDGSADVTEATGLVRHLTFTSINGRYELASASAPCMSCGNKFAAITYDGNGDGYISSTTDFNGNVTNYTHDAAGRETSRTEAYGTADQRTITTTRNVMNGLPEAIYEYNASSQLMRDTLYCYNVSGSACNDSTSAGTIWTVNVVDPNRSLTRITTYTYNSQGLLLTVDGPRTDVSDVTNFAYYTATVAGSHNINDLNTITDALGHVTTVTGYEANGNPSGITDPNSIATSFTYDARARLFSRSIGGATASYTYDSAGNLTKAILPKTVAGVTYTYTYDAAHVSTSIADNLGETVVYTLDASGNRKEEDTCASALNCGPGLSGDLKVHTRSYDNQDRLQYDTGGMGQVTQYVYDSNGNPTHITDPKGNMTIKSYDALNRMYQVQDPSGTTTYNLDSLDHVVDVTDPRGLDTHYTHDAYGDVITQQSPDTGTTGYTYDPAGNRLTKTDARSQTATYTYDALNRLAQITYNSSAETVIYTYDGGFVNGIGRLTKITDPSGTTKFTNFDAWGDLLQKNTTIAGQAFGTTYTYDAPADMTEIELMPPGQTTPTAFITYKHDAVGRQSEIDSTWWNGSAWLTYPVVSAAGYEPFGRLSSLHYQNSLTETRTYDQDYRLTGISIPSFQGLGFGYDADNNINSVTDSVNVNGNSYAATYGYDAMNRLTTAPGESVSYDADGNRTQTIVNGATTTYNTATTSNRLLSLTGAQSTTFTYAADGSRSDDGTYTYNYYDSGRFENLELDSTHAVTDGYIYNGLGQRTEKIAGTFLTYYLYDEAGHLQAEYSTTSGINAVHVWMNDRPVAYYKATSWNLAPTTARYIHTDQLDTPRVTTNSSGALVSAWYSDPFGNRTATIGGPAYELRFPGQYFDEERGLNYNYMRDYDPLTGRYIESDPIGLGGGINTYAYVGGNPLRHVDPFGLDDFYFNGTTLTQFNRSGNLVGTWGADSGPWGNGAAPEGNYVVSSPISVSSMTNRNNYESYCDPSENCWFAPLTPTFPTTRSGLGVHPDGGVPGTAGCIGVTNTDTTSLENALQNNPDSTVHVYYPTPQMPWGNPAIP
jgi:RHS repeat-associated protein